jgi:amino acid transporter
MGHQITGKVQAVLVTITLVGDILLGVCIWWLLADRNVWAANWAPPTGITWLSIFAVTGLWLAAMAGILEVQQVLVDEWIDFKQSRDVGLLSAAYQLWARQLPVALGLFATFPIGLLAIMPVPTVQAVQQKLGHGALFYLSLITMLVATYTTLSVYFMAEGKVLALYAQQGALPRIIGRYSSRSVPWVALIILLLMAIVGGFLPGYDFIINTLACWSATLYLVVAIVFIRMRRRKDLDRPLVAPFGLPIAFGLLAVTSLIALSSVVNNWRAAATWVGFISVIILYDWLVVPRTERGRFYRTQVLRRRMSAARL